jgi:hypothetical protein
MEMKKDRLTINENLLPPAHPELVEGQGFMVRQAHHERGEMDKSREYLKDVPAHRSGFLIDYLMRQPL